MLRDWLIAYNKNSGEVFDVIDGDEISGEVHQTTIEEAMQRPGLINVDPGAVDFLILEFGIRREEMLNRGSLKIDPVTKELIIFPLVQVQADKNEIQANGLDQVNITVTTQGETNLVVYVNGEQIITDITTGLYLFSFVADLPADYLIKVDAGIYGFSSLIIRGVNQ